MDPLVASGDPLMACVGPQFSFLKEKNTVRRILSTADTICDIEP